MLAEMTYLNTSHRLPVAATRTQLSTLDADVEQPRGHSDIELAHADVHSEAAVLEIDTYPSRHAYGARNVDDLNREPAQKARSDIAEVTARRARLAYENTYNNKKNGSARAVAYFVDRWRQSFTQKRTIVVEDIPDPIITVTPGRVQGEIKPLKYDYQIDVHEGAGADVKFNRGSFEAYIKQPGEINRWTSVGRYDIRI